MTRREMLVMTAAASIAQAAEPIIDIHQHTNYVDRTDEALVAHQRAMGVTTTVLLPAGRKFGLAAKAGGNDTVVHLAKQHPKEFVFFANELPDIPEADGEIRKFVDAYWPRFIDRHGRRRARLLILAVRLDQATPDVNEQIERDVITQFLIGSNFFQLADPGSETIEFSELPTSCPNPFYRT